MGKLNKRTQEKVQDKFQGLDGSKVKRSELLNALSAVTVGTGGQMILEGSQSVIFDNKWLRTYNDYLSVSYPFKSGIESAVLHDDLTRILNRMQDEDILLRAEEDQPLVIHGEFVRVELASSDVRIMKYIEDLALDDLDWKDLPEKFLEGLWWCYFSASRKKDDLYYSIFCTGDSMVSTDNYRVGVYKMEEEVDPFLISAGNALALLKAGLTLKEFVIVNGWIHMKSETGVIISSRLLDEEVFDATKVKAVVDRAVEEIDASKKPYTFPDGFENVLARADIFSFDKAVFSDVVEVAFQGNEIICSAKREGGNIKERAVTKEKNPPLKFLIPIFFLRDVLKITRKFYTSGNFIIFQTPDFTQLVLSIEE